MKIITAEDLPRLASYRDIVEAIREAFKGEVTAPVRSHHDTAPNTTFLLMPAWTKGFIGLKTVVLKTDNAAKGLPTVQASYLLFDADTGATLSVIDGTELTRRRTAAASALAADYLARKDTSTLVMVGAGALAPHFVRAHASVRPIRRVLAYNRTRKNAETLVKSLAGEFSAEVVTDLAKAVGEADIVSCVTTSTEAIVKGAWLKPGTHVDLAGAFKPPMRETDGEVVARASVYVDTRDGALAEAGDLLRARDEGKFRMEDVRGDLFDLCRGTVQGRKSAAEITLFKSCGTGIEDLAAAIMLHRRS